MEFKTTESKTTTPRKQNLCIMIDSTGSMGQWIAALRTVLPEFMHTVAITGVFDQVSILSYKDYDTVNIVEWSGWHAFNDPQIFRFAKSLIAAGGGDTPEAVRTALWELSKHLPTDTDVAILHLADAPEHPESPIKLGNEGRKEFVALEAKFPIRNVMGNLANAVKTNNVVAIYSSITTDFESPLMFELTKAHPGQRIIQTQISTSKIQESILAIFNNWCDGSSHWVIPEVAQRLNTAVVRLRQDEQFATYSYQCLKQCFEDNVMSMCNNETIGKIWREFSKRRGDQRRGELYSILDKAKHTLSGIDRKKFDEFNRNSYSNLVEIKEELDDWIAKNGINGVIRYVPDELMHPQDILKFCRDCLPESQKQIKEILARVVIDSNVVMDPVAAKLPPNCLPANMPYHMQLKYLLHLAAPGTVIGGRPVAILAMLARGTVLDVAATHVLTARKGKWLDFSYFEEDGPLKGTPKIPENYNSRFLRLINNHREFLTEEELNKLDWLLTILNVLRLPQIELEAEIMSIGCLDGNYPDYGRLCVQCNKHRPLSLVNRDSICGYCLSGMDCPYEFNPESTYQIQCTKCFAVYARNPRANIPGRALCYGCRSGESVSPTVTCTECNIKYITYHGLPHKICAGCAESKKRKQRTEMVLRRATDLFAPADFVQIYKSVGINADGIINVGLVKANETLTQCVVEPAEELKVEANDTILNRSALYKKMLEFAQGARTELPECALCCNSVTQDKIGRACGRKGCTQRICNDCGVNWYGVLKAGSLILERHLVCPFCARKPDSRVMRRWCPGAIWFSAQAQLDPANYYAWCVQCNHAKLVGPRECAAGQPQLNNWRCDSCVNPLPDAKNDFKECPNCGIAVERVSGCNHITCRCLAHWCFECTILCSSAEETYEHMRREHGRIYANEEPYYDDLSDVE